MAAESWGSLTEPEGENCLYASLGAQRPQEEDQRPAPDKDQCCRAEAALLRGSAPRLLGPARGWLGFWHIQEVSLLV